MGEKARYIKHVYTTIMLLNDCALLRETLVCLAMAVRHAA
jgi:hypothetical protein